jgi:uncharacterized protein YxeA
MKKLIIIFILIVIILSTAASYFGVISYQTSDYQTFTTARGDKVEVQMEGIYKYNTKAYIVSGTPWDLVRLLFGIN